MSDLEIYALYKRELGVEAISRILQKREGLKRISEAMLRVERVLERWGVTDLEK